MGASLLLVAATAVALVAVVSDSVKTAAMVGSDTANQSIVSVLVATDLPAADLSLSGVSQARVDEIQGELKTLIIRAKGIPHVKIFAPDETILYSNLVGLRGENRGPDDDLADAFATGDVAPSTVSASDPDAATTGLPPDTQVLEE